MNNSFIGPIESYLIFLGILKLMKSITVAFIFTKLNLSNRINFKIKKKTDNN